MNWVVNILMTWLDEGTTVMIFPGGVRRSVENGLEEDSGDRDGEEDKDRESDDSADAENTDGIDEMEEIEDSEGDDVEGDNDEEKNDEGANAKDHREVKEKKDEINDNDED